MTHRKRPSGAFTLIEVLLTTVLAATLLAALWALMSMYARTFEVGQTKTEQSQLARALLARISEDLQNIVQPPPPAPPLPVLVAAVPNVPVGNPGTTSPPAGQPPQTAKSTAASATASGSSSTAASTNAKTSPPASNSAGSATATLPPANPQPPAVAGNAALVTSSLRPAGLFGTENYLQVDVLQATVVQPEQDLTEAAPSGAVAPSRAPELRTIAYSLEDVLDPKQPVGQARMCLARREIDWEQAHPASRGTAARRNRNSQPGTGAIAPGGEPFRRDPRTDGGPDDTATRVPEVMSFAVRYFDGTTWANQWDSAARKGLPVAVEIALQLRSFDDPEPPPPHHSAGEAIGEEPEFQQAKFPVYRLLIHLPSARPQTGGGSMHGAAGRPWEADSHAEFR